MAYNFGMVEPSERAIGLGEFCDRLQIPERRARYILEQGHVPPGIEKTPDSGNHRRFHPDQALWLAVVVTLKDLGIKTPVAAEIASTTDQIIRGAPADCARNGVQPALSQLSPPCWLEIAEAKYIRLILRELQSDWCSRMPCGHYVAAGSEFRPRAVVRLDLSLIAQQVAGTPPAELPLREALRWPGRMHPSSPSQDCRSPMPWSMGHAHEL